MPAWEYWINAISHSGIAICALLVILVPLAAWSARAGMRKKLRNRTKENMP